MTPVSLRGANTLETWDVGSACLPVAASAGLPLALLQLRAHPGPRSQQAEAGPGRQRSCGWWAGPGQTQRDWPLCARTGELRQGQQPGGSTGVPLRLATTMQGHCVTPHRDVTSCSSTAARCRLSVLQLGLTGQVSGEVKGHLVMVSAVTRVGEWPQQTMFQGQSEWLCQQEWVATAGQTAGPGGGGRSSMLEAPG